MQPDEQPKPDYNFIMNSKPPKKGLFGSGSQKSRILMVIAGLGLLLVIFGFIFSLLFGGSTNNTEQMVPIAAKQVEIIRVAEIGEKQASSITTKNYASAVKLSMTSAHEELVSLLASQDRKVNNKELVTAKDEDSDMALETATQTNKFDEVFTTTIKKQLLDYQRDVRAIFNASSGKERAALQSLYNQTKLLATDID